MSLRATNAVCQTGKLLFRVEMFSTFGLFLGSRLTAPNALSDSNLPNVGPLSG